MLPSMFKNDAYFATTKCSKIIKWRPTWVNHKRTINSRITQKYREGFHPRCQVCQLISSCSLKTLNGAQRESIANNSLLHELCQNIATLRKVSQLETLLGKEVCMWHTAEKLNGAQCGSITHNYFEITVLRKVSKPESVAE